MTRRLSGREKEAIKTKHVVRRCCGRSQGLVPFACLRSISPSPPIDAGRLTDSRLVFSLFSRLFQSIHLYFFLLSITPTTSSRLIQTSSHPHLPPRSTPSSRLPQVILHNGYTWSNQRCKDKSCVFRILCAQMPIPVSLSVRSHIGCSYLFWPLRLLTPQNPSSIPLRPTPCLHHRTFLRNFVIITTAIDDPRKVVKVVASDGKTGDTRDISYTNCKVIGNGSFGVVFQAKLVSDPESGEDIAIKKVLQDKRFKVSDTFTSASLVLARVDQKRSQLIDHSHPHTES